MLLGQPSPISAQSTDHHTHNSAGQSTLHLAEVGQVGIPLPCGYSVFWIKKARDSPSVLWQNLRSSNLIYEWLLSLCLYHLVNIPFKVGHIAETQSREEEVCSTCHEVAVCAISDLSWEVGMSGLNGAPLKSIWWSSMPQWDCIWRQSH